MNKRGYAVVQDPKQEDFEIMQEVGAVFAALNRNRERARKVAYNVWLCTENPRHAQEPPQEPPSSSVVILKAVGT